MNDLTYFEWLMSLVSGNIQLDSNDYILAERLNAIVYRWHFSLDENRAVAGKSLRQVYLDIYGLDDDEVPGGECTVLEMLIALARRMSENSNRTAEDCYREMIHNLNVYGYSEEIVNQRINNWLDGNFDSNGDGTPFPLKHYQGDCRNLDIWTQMTIYINENYPLDKNWINE